MIRARPQMFASSALTGRESDLVKKSLAAENPERPCLFDDSPTQLWNQPPALSVFIFNQSSAKLSLKQDPQQAVLKGFAFSVLTGIKVQSSFSVKTMNDQNTKCIFLMFNSIQDH